MSNGKLEHLDHLVRTRIRIYLNELSHGNTNNVLSEEDMLAAALHAKKIYMENTPWSERFCTNRAIDIADREKTQISNKMAETTTYGVGWPD